MNTVIIPDDDDSDQLSAATGTSKSSNYEKFGSNNLTPSFACFPASSLYSIPVPPRQQYHEASNVQYLLKLEREREGQCGDCGIQTHEVSYSNNPQQAGHCRVRTPLTITHVVYRGRCLLCHPITPDAVRNCNFAGSNDSSAAWSALLREERTSDNTGVSQPQHYRRMPSPEEQSVPIQRQSFSGFDDTLNTSRDQSTNLGSSFLSLHQDNIMDILLVMRALPHDRHVQRWGCERLWILGWEDDTAAAIGRVGGVDVILRAMRRFSRDEAIQQCACEALSNLVATHTMTTMSSLSYSSSTFECTDPAAFHRRELYELGGIPCLIQALRRHGPVAALQRAGCLALASLAWQDPGHAKEILRAGGWHVLQRALLYFGHHGADDCLEAQGVMSAARDAARALVAFASTCDDASSAEPCTKGIETRIPWGERVPNVRVPPRVMSCGRVVIDNDDDDDE